MEGQSSWKPNEQGGDSLPNDWRSQHDPDLRKKVVLAIVERLKSWFPRRTADDINRTACIFEDKIYRMAKDKGDYLRKIHERIMASTKIFRTGGTSSANGANTPDPAAQPLNQGKSLPTSLTHAQTPTSQPWLSQSNIPESSGLPTQAPMNVSAAQNLNIQMGEGFESNLGPGPQKQIQGRQQLLQKPQKQQQKSSNTMYQHQMDQQRLKEKTHHGYQPQQHHQQMPRHRSLSPIEQFVPQSSALSSHQQKMGVPSQQHKTLERKHHISQLMNGQDTQQTHLTSQQSNGEKQRTSQNSMASFNVHGSTLLGTQGQEVEQSQPMMLQHSNDTQRFQTAGSMRQSQNLADQQKHPYQFQTAQPAKDPSTSQDSIGKMLNISGGDWREETYQKIKALKEKHATVLNTMLQRLSVKLQEIDSLPDQQKMAYEHHAKNLRVGKGALEQVLVFLHVSRRSVSEKHRDKFSVYERQILKFIKSQMEKQQQQQQVHLHPSHQTHQTALQSQSGQVHVSQSLDSVQMNSSFLPSPLSSSVSCLKTSRPKVEPKDDNMIMSSSGNVVVQHSLEQHSNIISPAHQQLLQRQQEQQTNQQQHLQIPKNEINDVRMSQRSKSKAELLQQHLSSSQRQVPKPPIASPARMSNLSPLASSPQMQNHSSPQLVEQQPPVTLPEPSSERPIDRLIKAIQSSSPESLAQSVSEMSSIISLTDRFAGSVQSIGGFRARLGEDLSERTRLRLQRGHTNPTKRFKRSLTTMPSSQTGSYKQFSVINKIEPSYALLQEITEINRILVETVVSICNEDACPSEEVTSGSTVVTCSYVPVALSATFKALYNSEHISQIQPLRLLVPENYPSSSIILDKVLFDTASVHKYEDLSARARSRFGTSITEYSEAMSLKEIAKVWDECARATMLEYAKRHGGGTFSSKYGRWESVLKAS